ncbi:PREDICTED: lysosomal alpha-glucosidase-like [Priapulus caudatus]|uniref:Lysosomal alpha-glucosidase-like n=1 Tax=Priapulus caudatus TaxID=37621 RepID=A0ABM1EK71_PRICU|nr:PREDICTED: lysosomal alpha-glucosidase-like [Priapulus caudatus]
MEGVNTGVLVTNEERNMCKNRHDSTKTCKGVESIDSDHSESCTICLKILCVGLVFVILCQTYRCLTSTDNNLLQPSNPESIELDFSVSPHQNDGSLRQVLELKNAWPPIPGHDVRRPKLFDGFCTLVPDELKFECDPEDERNKTTCEGRGCCWLPLVEPNAARNVVQTTDKFTGTVIEVTLRGTGVPSCYYPLVYPGYRLTDLVRKEWGYSATLYRDVPSYHPDDVMELAMDVMLETKTRLHFKIYDPNEKRYEVPIETPRVAKAANVTDYIVTVRKMPFSFKVTRRSTQTVLFDTGVGNMIFADQFLQLSSRLPSHAIYGLGEHQDSFMLPTNWSRFAFWNKGNAPNLGDLNLYGMHPFYLVMEDNGDSFGVLLLNSNAMEMVLQPTPAITFRTIGGIFDFYLFTGPDPASVIQQYLDVIGRPAMPPYWALGYHLCRWGYDTALDMGEVINRMRKSGIPYDVQWNDLDYMDKELDFTLRKPSFTQLPYLVGDLHMQGQRYVPIVDPGISVTQGRGNYPPFDEGVNMDIFIKNASGLPVIGTVSILSFSLFGMPLVGADICGFAHDATEQLCQRWTQLGAFYPFARNHNAKNSQAQDPTGFGAAMQGSALKSLQTRYRLLPYLYTLFHLAATRGETVARPLMFEFPKDSKTYSVDEQFMWGAALLISPVLKEHATSVRAYLPRGIWYGFYSGFSLPSNGSYVNVDVRMDETCLHVRGGHILPTQVPASTTTESRQNKFGLLVALSERGEAEGEMFWDDGESMNTHHTGVYNAIRFNATKNSVASWSVHAGYSSLMVLGSIDVFGVCEPPSAVFVNGAEAKFIYSSWSKVLHVEDMDLDFLQKITVNWS